MRQKPETPKPCAKKVVKDIRQRTRTQHSAEDKTRVVLEGLRGEASRPRFTRAYDRAGQEVAGADPRWQALHCKPHGTARAGSSYLMSDSGYVEVLTEIDIPRPIPGEVQERRSGGPLMFLGCRLDDQLLRIFARQIAKRSGQEHITVMPGPLTRMERRFLKDGGVTRLDLARHRGGRCAERNRGLKGPTGGRLSAWVPAAPPA